MPKGYPKGKLHNHMWFPEMDEALTAYVADGYAYSQCRDLMNAKFPGKHWTRSAIIGRAGRMGLQSRNPQYLHAGGAPRKSRKGSTYNTPKKGRAKKTAVNVQSVLDARKVAGVRTDEENVMGVSHALPKTRATPEVIAQRKIGNVLNIVDGVKPKTSKLISECTGNECRWPATNDLRCMEVCGADATYGAYCEDHGSRAYRVGMTNRRNAAYHKEDREHTVRLHHELDTADQDVIPIFIGHGGADALLLEDHSHQDLEDAE